MNKGFTIRAVGVLFLAFLLLFSVGTDSRASRVEELREMEKELQSEKAKLREVKKKESKALNSLYVVNKKLKKAKSDLSGINSDISATRRKIAALEGEIGDIEREIKARGRLLSQRIGEAYKSGGTLNVLELLFASRSIADFVNREYYFEKIISRDASLIAEIKEKIVAAEASRRELDRTLGRMHDLERSLSRKKVDIEHQAKTKKRIYSNLKDRRAEYERRVAELEKGSKELEALINRSVSKSRESGGQPGATGRMIWPSRGRLVSRFGYRRHPLWGGTHLHTGIDIGAPYGEPIRAADGGEVIFSGWWDGYGKAVVIDHGSNLSTVYGHMSRIYVQSGQRLGKSQIIGLIGSTGFSTGPHLHFEVRRNGRPVNPLPYL